MAKKEIEMSKEKLGFTGMISDGDSSDKEKRRGKKRIKRRQEEEEGRLKA